MDLKPLFDRVILKNLKKENTTKSGLIIPESAGDEPLLAEVLARSPRGNEVHGCREYCRLAEGLRDCARYAQPARLFRMAARRGTPGEPPSRRFRDRPRVHRA